MDGIDQVHGAEAGGDGLRVVQATEEERTGGKQKPDDGGLRVEQAREEEQAAIRAMLSRRMESAPAGTGAGRASALAWAGLRLAAAVLLTAGIELGYADGNEFDDVGCSVALRPARTSHEARSGQTRERAGGKMPGSGGGAAGSSGSGGGPYGGKGEEGLRTTDYRTTGLPDYGGKAFPIKLLKLVLGSTLDQQAAIGRLLKGEVLPEPQQGGPSSARNQVLAERSSQKGKESNPAYVFRWTGPRWEVVCGGGRPFRLRNTLGARYLNYLLHEPNEPIRAFDLEVEVQPQKGEARVVDSIQPESDQQALREYRQELRRLKAERAKTRAAGSPEESEGLDGQIAALELALKERSAAADTGERARNNVRKALAVVLKQLREGGPEEKAFAEHLDNHLSIGHECLYSQPEGRIWG